ncbi:MAG: cytochrome c [Phenylobacterium sp.]|jgi:cytochrome c5|nr:cytochrome c [Phenylobacterium sp.]
MSSSRASWSALLSLALIAAALPAGAAHGGSPPDPSAASAPKAAATTEAPEAVLKRACQACHDLGVITQSSHTADEWPAILQRMRSNGANVTDAELKAVQAYLIDNYSATQ